MKRYMTQHFYSVEEVVTADYPEHAEEITASPGSLPHEISFPNIEWVGSTMYEEENIDGRLRWKEISSWS